MMKFIRKHTFKTLPQHANHWQKLKDEFLQMRANQNTSKHAVVSNENLCYIAHRSFSIDDDVLK